MPFLELITNVTLTRAQTEALALSLSSFAAETLKKPEAVFGINVRANEVLTFGGNWDPCFQLRITSIGNLQPEKNIGYTKAFSTFLKDKLGVESDRGYIIFYDPESPNIGYMGTTVAEMTKT